jgi:hypothetical protein
VISFFSRPLRLVALVAVIGIAGGVYWVWHGAHTSTAVSQDGVLAEYRAKGVSDAPPAPGVPASGVYRYRATGTESAGSGVLSASRSLPAEAVYVITPTAGGYHEDLRLSEEHVEEADFAVGERGASATWRRTKITFLGIGEDDRDSVEPPAFDHPAPSKFSVGRSWKGTYRLGDLDVAYTGKVTGRETAQLDGTAVEVFVIRTDSTFRGSTPGTRTDVLRWSPELSLPVAWSITQKTGGDAEFAIDADLTLVSGVPQR